MKPIQSLFSLFILIFPILLSTSCKKDDNPEPTADNGNLAITILDQFTTLPAKVSIFFKVDTKDGNPVAGLLDSDFTIFEKGRNDTDERLISVDEAERQISPSGQVFTYNTLLVLDLSGSVTNNNLDALKSAANQFIDSVMPVETDSSINMGIWWFDGEDKLHELATLSPDKEHLHQAINNITATISNDNSTDLYGAVIKSTAEAEMILVQFEDIISAASVVIFTDGTDQAARYTKESALTAVSDANPKITYYSIGLGSEIDPEVLQQIGKNSSAFAENTSQLISKFTEIAQSINDQANSYYLFEYCSPKRDGSGVSDLRILVKRGNNSGSELTTFDATGFKGGCEL